MCFCCIRNGTQVKQCSHLSRFYSDQIVQVTPKQCSLKRKKSTGKKCLITFLLCSAFLLFFLLFCLIDFYAICQVVLYYPTVLINIRIYRRAYYDFMLKLKIKLSSVSVNIPNLLYILSKHFGNCPQSSTPKLPLYKFYEWFSHSHHLKISSHFSLDAV